MGAFEFGDGSGELLSAVDAGRGLPRHERRSELEVLVNRRPKELTVNARLLLPAWAGLLFACATAGGPATPPATPPFQGVASVVLVRRADDRDRRPRDALDGLDESLRVKGLATRTVEVGPRLREELKGVERLFHDVEWRIRSSPSYGPSYGPDRRATESLGRAPRELLEKLGADAFAVYLRFDDRYGSRPPPPPGDPLPGARPLGTFPGRPTSALALVDRDGTLLWFDWGGPEDLEVPESRVVNAAEAVDEAVRVLAGEPRLEEL
jgi:hypothetical protein